jgi:ABC-type transport system involved in cytochrome c biogenesis ATPase subunit
MSYGLSGLTLVKVRGATSRTDIKFEPDAHVVLIHGANGAGKSTILDGLDMVANGRCGSIDDRGSATVREHVASVGATGRQVRVDLTTSGSMWTARLAGSLVSVDGPSPRPPIFVLRRYRVARLVEARPAERYDALRSLIDVAGVERAEATLITAANSAKRTLDAALERHGEADAALGRLWVASGGLGNDHREWALSVTRRPGTDSLRAAGPLQALLGALDHAEAARGTASAAQKGLAAARQGQDRARSAAAQAATLSGTDAIGLVDLLRQAQSAMEQDADAEVCPVCSQRIDRATLRTALAERLSRLGTWRALSKAVRDADEAAGHAEAEARRADQELVAAVDALACLWEQAPAAVPRLEATEADTGAADPPSRARTAALGLLQQALAGRTQLEHELDRTRAAATLRTAVATQLAHVEEAEEAASAQAGLADHLRAMLTIVQSRRKGFAQQMLDRVAGETARLYELVHPGEGVALQALTLDPARRGSLVHTTQFHGAHGVAPQGYLSDGHMDTLGLCLWLAVVKETGGPNAIVALDDVLTSLDDTHLARLVAMLTAESRHFTQLIVTTHQRAWHDHARRETATTAARMQAIELLPWSVRDGVQVRIEAA